MTALPAIIRTVVAIAPGVRRLVADNPGPLTGPGTNTYIVGTGEVAVIDPGPADNRHRDAILAATRGETIAAILVTHRHGDHADGAPALSAETGARILAAAPESIPGAKLLADGGRVDIRGWTIEAVATPGHCRDHLCFAVSESPILFSGDHVMGWATTMIAPPDGSLAGYRASLQRLLDRPEIRYLPGHGEPIEDGPARVRALFAHREQRETEILAALGAGDRTLRDIMRRVYPSLDPTLVQAATYTLIAHLTDLAERRLVDVRGGDISSAWTTFVPSPRHAGT